MFRQYLLRSCIEVARAIPLFLITMALLLQAMGWTLVRDML